MFRTEITEIDKPLKEKDKLEEIQKSNGNR
jgi:hypothetical protein